jgi:hypothetical protein
LIYIGFFDHCGWCESGKKYKIRVIHGACAGFSLKWLPNLLQLLASTIFHSEKVCRTLFYEYLWKSFDIHCFFDHCGCCESRKKYKIIVIHGACAGFSLKWFPHLLLLLADTIFHSIFLEIN